MKLIYLFFQPRLVCLILNIDKISSRNFALFTGFFSVFVGVTVLIGWMTDTTFLKSIIPAYISMKANTAIGFIFIGFSLVVSQKCYKKQIPYARFFCLLEKIFLLCVLFIAISAMLENILKADFGIDQFFFKDPAVYFPGKLPPLTIASFIILTVALICAKCRHTVIISQFLCLIVFLLLTLPLYGYAFENPDYSVFVYSYSRMALHTAITFFILSLGIFFSRADQGLIALVRSDTLGGMILRRLFPVLVFGLPFLEWLVLRGQYLGFYSVEFGLSLKILFSIIILLAILYWEACLIDSLNERRKKIEQSYREKEKRFNFAMEAAQIGAWDLDLASKTSVRSLKHDQIFGYKTPLPHWSVEIFLQHVVPESRDSIRAQIEHSIQTSDIFLVCEIIKLDQTHRWVSIRGHLYRDSKNNPSRMLGIIEDITDNKLNDEKLKCYAIKLKQSNKELEDFASIASHDLQEPLRKVQAFGNRLKDKCAASLNEEGLDYLGRMLNAAERMHNLINALLSYSRLSTKAVSFIEVSLNQVVKEVLSDLEIKIEQTQAIIEVKDLPNIEADVMQMCQLFQNIIGNALKFSRPNVPPIIKIYNNISSLKRDQFEIIIEDNGIGFDEKYLDKLFNMFQRLHARDEYEGTGIGLAVCRRIAEHHLGGITARSVLNQGTKFIITLASKHQDTQNKIEGAS